MTTKAKAYHWFQGASVRALIEQLNEAGPDPRLEVRVDGKKKMTFKVVGGDYDGPAINESHVCPPDCPH